MNKPRTRLFVTHSLCGGTTFPLTESQFNFLVRSLRCQAGARIAVFNGRDGEWLAELVNPGKRSAELSIIERRAMQAQGPDLWLVFAPVKNEKIDFTVRRATELGVSALLPVMTQRTIVSRVNLERLEANAIEAAEQCGRMDVPQLREPQKLPAVLAEWNPERLLLYCDESGGGKPVSELMPALPAGPAAVLIGPEGGFTLEERTLIASLPFVRALSLGPRILRAETAALAALAHAQAWVGDGDMKSNFEGAG